MKITKMVRYGLFPALVLMFGVNITTYGGVPAGPTFGDLVWDDLDGDGIVDVGEPGLPDITVNVCGVADISGDADCSSILSTFSDENGNYFLQTNFFSANGYFVSVDTSTVPTGYIATTLTSRFYDNSISVINTADFGFQAVPVPAAVWLFGSGLLGLVGAARRKRAM